MFYTIAYLRARCIAEGERLCKQCQSERHRAYRERREAGTVHETLDPAQLFGVPPSDKEFN